MCPQKLWNWFPDPVSATPVVMRKSTTTILDAKVDDSVEKAPQTLRYQFGKSVRYQFGSQHVIFRNVCFGTRSAKGSENVAVFASTAHRTARNRPRDALPGGSEGGLKSAKLLPADPVSDPVSQGTFHGDMR